MSSSPISSSPTPFGMSSAAASTAPSSPPAGDTSDGEGLDDLVRGGGSLKDKPSQSKL